MSSNPVEEKSLQSFAQFLQSLDYGNVHDEITRKVQELVGDLAEHKGQFGGKPKGKMVISLDFALDDNLMEVTPDIKVTVPKAKHGKSMYFVTPENRLTREDPRQRKLPLDEAREKKYNFND